MICQNAQEHLNSLIDNTLLDVIKRDQSIATKVIEYGNITKNIKIIGSYVYFSDISNNIFEHIYCDTSRRRIKVL